MSLVKSKQRVADHGEVFTPDWLVQNMLDLVKDESERIDSRFLEPACGSGNFLVAVLARKLATAKRKYGKREFEFRHHALLAVMSIYGIELLPDNAEECRQSLLEAFCGVLKVALDSEWGKAAHAVLEVNVVRGDALTMMTLSTPPEPIAFPEWAYLGKGKYQRRDFKFQSLTMRSSLGEGTLFEDLGSHEVFTPIREYSAMTVAEIAHG